MYENFPPPCYFRYIYAVLIITTITSFVFVDDTAGNIDVPVSASSPTPTPTPIPIPSDQPTT